jgi:hypothetical protein
LKKLDHVFGTKIVGQKDVILKNEPEKLLIIKKKTTYIAKNEPKNEAEKLLKTGSCGKNEPKTNQSPAKAILPPLR